MIKKYLSPVVAALFFFVAGSARAAWAPTPAPTAAKLPYAAGERFVVVQGYHSPPTHVGKDNFAIDFSQDGCDAYGKSVVASVSGIAFIVRQSGYNGGYGTELVTRDARNIFTRYAHMIPGSVVVSEGSVIRQGEVVGRIGNTGLVEGNACKAHPGAHVHFAMYGINSAGVFIAYDPEPLSGYSNITKGQWYVSDNAALAVAPPASGMPNIIVRPSIFASATGTLSTPTPPSVSPSAATQPIISPVPATSTGVAPSTTVSAFPLHAGGVSVAPAPAPSPVASVAPVVPVEDDDSSDCGP